MIKKERDVFGTAYKFYNSVQNNNNPIRQFSNITSTKYKIHLKQNNYTSTLNQSVTPRNKGNEMIKSNLYFFNR